MMQMCQPYAHFSVSASDFVSNKSNKENVLLKWWFFFGVFLRLVLCVCVCFYECEPSVRLQRVGVQGLLEKVCQQQRFYKCLLCIEINTLGLGGGWAWPMRAVFHNHLRFKNTVFFPHRGAALDCFCFTFPTRCIPMKKHTMWRDKGNDQCADIFLLKCWKEHEQVEISSVF